MNQPYDPNATADMPSVPADSIRAADPLGTTDHARGAASTDGSHRDADAPARDLPVVPGYRVVREIARGGMGRVLVARDLSLDRDVALKILLPGAKADRFVRESKITARLPHPGIPPVHALGTLADGSPFLAMKLIAGQTLAQEMKTADRPRLLQTFAQVCQAVGFAHSRGIIHRDLKPANVMVGAFGEVQVMDWGLAKEVGNAESGMRIEKQDSAGSSIPHSPFPIPQSDETQAGAVMGTPAYMAPEQARGAATDARSDVFALGGILCAILTGQPPFVGRSSLEVIQRAGAADLAEANARLDGCGADAELVALCRLCLSPHPEERPANGQAVADDLNAYLNGVQERLLGAERERAVTVARAIEERRRRKVQVIAASLVLLALAVGTTVSYLKYRDAEKEKMIAENRRKDAQTSEADAVAARSDVEKTNDRLVTTVAQSLLRTLAVQGRTNQGIQGLNDPEIAALWEVGSSKDERLHSRFVEEALRDLLSTRQLTDRAAFALQAAVGLDETRRTQVEELFGGLLQAKETPQEQKENLAICLRYLGVRDRSLAEKTVATLTQAMSKTFEPFRLQQLSESLLAMAARMEPKEAAAALTQAMSKTTDPGSSARRQLARGLSAASARMEPQEGVATLTLAISKNLDPRALAALAQGLSAAAARLEPKQANQVCGQAAVTLNRAISASIASEATRDLAQGLSAVAAHMEPKEANLACGQAAANLNLAMTRTPHIPWLLHLSEGLSAVVIRMEPKEANQACGQAAATLIKTIDTGFGPDLQLLSESLSALATRMEPKEAVATLTQAMQGFTPQQVQFFNSEGLTPFDSLSRGLSAAATRMEPTEAAEAAAALTLAMSKAKGPRNLAGLSQGLSVVAARMDPKDAAQVCGQAAATLTQTMSKTMDPIALAGLSQSLSLVAARMEPKEAAATLTLAISKTTEPRAMVVFAQGLSAAAARMEPKEAASTLTRTMSKAKDAGTMAALAQGLSAAAARMEPKDAAQLCGQIAATFTEAVSKTTDSFALRPLAQGLSALADRMDSKDAARLCGQTAANFTEQINKTTASLLSSPRRTDAFDLSETRPLNVLQMLSEGLSALAARMDRKDAAQLCGQVAATFTVAMSKSTDPNTFVFFSDLAAGLAALAARMEPMEAAQLCGQAAAAINLAASKLSSAPTILQSLSERLSALALRMEPKEAATTLIQAMSRLSPANPYESASLKGLSEGLSAVVVREASPLPPQTLVDILKHPFCVGEPRSLVLEQLSRHYHRPFADQWEFVAYVHKNKLDLDLTTPSERPRHLP